MISTDNLLTLLEEQEAILQFDVFSNYDAFLLGGQLVEKLKNSPIPVAIRVFIGDIVVFQYTMQGKEESHYDWTRKKYNVVKAIRHSSMYGKILVKCRNELKELQKQKSEYGFGCGGFPITVKGQGIIGAVCVSGLPDPMDHVMIVEALGRQLEKTAPLLPEKVCSGQLPDVEV